MMPARSSRIDAVSSRPISRRTFLRGTGVALGLPILEAMGPILGRPHALAAAPSTPGAPIRPPVRMACLYFPNGVWQPSWIPKQAGFGYDVPPSLEPLGALRDEVTVLSGLDKANSRQGDGHYAKTANFLTGLPVRKTTGKEVDVGGISIDQLCAARIGGLTPLPSLELAVDPVITGIDSNVGYTRLYGSYISWRTPTTPLAREIHPRRAYERLFGVRGAGAGDPRSAIAAQRSDDDRRLLDLVLEDAQHLRDRLGRDDRQKLDEYMDSVRAVEQRIEFYARPDPREWKPAAGEPTADVAPPAGAPGDHCEHVRLMLDLIVLAFQTDSTRVATFMFANDVSGKNFGALIPGVSGSHHEFSHHEGKAEKYEPYAKINRWHVAQLAYMLERMRAIREGDGSLLDHSMVLFGSSFSDGNRHDPNNLPILLAGRGGGDIAAGQHIASPPNTPLCNLYVSMVERMGTPVERFGDSTEALDLRSRGPRRARV